MKTRYIRAVWTALLALSLLQSFPATAQTYWASRQQGNNVDETLGVTGDADGNAYATGYFSTLATISGTSLTSTGLTDIFLTKIHADGSPAWSVKAGGSLSDRGLAVATTADGEVVVCGFFTGTATFGDGVTLSATANSQDAFVAKYDADGNIVWARAGGSSGSSDRANAVATDAEGHVFITGQYTGEASFGTLNLTGTGNTNEVFVVKYSPDGDELWARSGNGNALNRGLGIATDDAGAVYACGQFSGDISFETTYNNDILNALFVVKYGADGSEAWMRYAGGAQQSIAYSIASDGTDVFITGDCGEGMTFANTPGFPQITTGYAHAVFLASLSPNGDLLWTTSQGSSSPVSGRGIAYHGGELAVAAWYECTYDELSGAYGASVFNNVGFRDIAIMRFTDAGELIRAQQFGSRTSEVPSGIHILPDGLEVVGGTYTTNLVMPITWSVGGVGFHPNLLPNHNAGLTYCGDPHYGEFRHIVGSAAEDGFMVKAVDPQRAPYDFYIRANQVSCDLSDPGACVVELVNATLCKDTISGCPFITGRAQNFVAGASSFVGYSTQYSWSSGNSGASVNLNTSGLYPVVMTSSDGCYVDSAEVYMDVFPVPAPALISDDYVVNTLSSNPQDINLCPGEEVTLWATSEHEGYWSLLGPGQPDDSITVSNSGTYIYTTVNAFGCTRNISVFVLVDGVPPPAIDPVLAFSPATDTIVLCQGQPFQPYVLDLLTGAIPSDPAFDFGWTISPSGNISGQGGASATVPATGWYTISVDIDIEDGLCWSDSSTYQPSDSIYVVVHPNPTVSIDLSGPQVICPADTIWLEVTTTADGFSLNSGNAVVWNEDSVAVLGPGVIGVSAFVVNEFGCSANANATQVVEAPSSPAIFSDPDPPVICPEGTVSLGTNEVGGYQWFGPSGETGSTQTVEVDEVGLYFVVVEVYEGCSLVSNTLQVAEYATPFLISSNDVLCPDSTTVLTVVPEQGGNIVWELPLSGNSQTQVVDAPGLYEATVEACGITTTVGIEIGMSEMELTVEATDTIPVCPGDSMSVAAAPGFTDLVWLPAPGGAEGLAAWYFENASVQATAIDVHGCPRTSNVVALALNVPPPPPVIDVILPCEGQPAQASINSPFNITWVAEPGGDTLHVGALINLGILDPDTTVYAFLSNGYCPGLPSSYTIEPKPLPEVPIPGTNAPVCTGTLFELEVLNPEPGAVYSWSGPLWTGTSGTLVTVPAIGMEMEGTYAVVPQLDGCVNDTAFIYIALIETVEAVLPVDTAVCEQSNFYLAPDTIFATYLWQDGSTDSLYFPTSNGSYTLITTDFNGCQSVATSEMELVDCSVIIPNVFTPNGDGINDLWVISMEQPQSFQLDVYNRWGRTVYESNKVSQWWDGTNFRNGEPCPDGVYYYVGSIVSFEGTPYDLTGTIYLTRE